jgi:hypothetical protein
VVRAIFGSEPRIALQPRLGEFYSIEGTDVGVSLHPIVARSLAQGDWGAAHEAAENAADVLDEDGYQPDGLAVRVGESWQERFKEPGAQDG